MYSTTTQAPPQNTYKDGRLSAGAFAAHEKMQGFGSMIGHPPPKTIQTRYYVTGRSSGSRELTRRPTESFSRLFTDAVPDIRYYCTLKFVYPHGATPSADQVMSMVGEVLKVQQDDSAPADNKGEAAGSGRRPGSRPATTSRPARRTTGSSASHHSVGPDGG